MFDKINVEYISENFIKEDNTYGLTLRGEKEKIDPVYTESFIMPIDLVCQLFLFLI